MDDALTKCYALILAFLGFVNVLLMLEVIGRKGQSGTFRVMHRWIGTVFVLSFLVLLAFMLPRIRSLATFPTHILLHSVIALAIVPLVVGKYLVVKRYRNFLGSAALTQAEQTCEIKPTTQGGRSRETGSSRCATQALRHADTTENGERSY